MAATSVPIQPATYTIEEMRKILRCSRPTVYRGIRDGVLPSIRIGGRLFILRVATDRRLAGEDQTEAV